MYIVHMVSWYIFPVWASCSKKNLATLAPNVVCGRVMKVMPLISTGFLLGPTAFGGNATNPLIPLSAHAETFQVPRLVLKQSPNFAARWLTLF
jgi:hypothetical protein